MFAGAGSRRKDLVIGTTLIRHLYSVFDTDALCPSVCAIFFLDTACQLGYPLMYTIIGHITYV